MLILAVAILIGENLFGGVWLVASHTERQTDIPEILCHKPVKPFHLVCVRVKVSRQFLRLRANDGSGCGAFALESGVPRADFSPILECRQLNRRPLRPL